jgi:hypothetical protein
MATIWDDKIPRSLTGAEKDCKLVELETIEQVENGLRTSTYWYQRLAKSKVGRSRHARALLRMIGGYSGFSDHRLKESELLSTKPSHEGFQRLRNITATIDGWLAQLMLSFPENELMWRWATYDRIIHSMMVNLIPDYCKPVAEKGTFYGDLKQIRKRIKEEGFKPSGDLSKIAELKRCRFSYLVPLLGQIGPGKTMWNMVQVSMLSQTRAAGVPPPDVKRRAIDDWVAVASTPADPALADEVMPAVCAAVDDFVTEVVKGAGEDQLITLFRRCSKSAKISLSDSAELDVPTNMGGKLEATRRVVSKLGRVMELDLETGHETGKFFTPEVGGIGEMMFHHTLAKWKAGPYTDGKMSVRVKAVPELGKYRVITVSSLDHAVLLHPMSHTTLAFFGEYAPTAAGIKSGNQAWEFFRRLSGANPAASFIFDETPRKSVMSTDWKSATDYCDHYLARGMLNRFMMRIGFPAFYRKMCIFALTAPRMVLDPLKEGKIWLTTRGVLMGDPGTKTVLTLYHPVVKFLALRAIRDYAAAEEVDDSASGDMSSEEE